jgi:hypothetical protein
MNPSTAVHRLRWILDLVLILLFLLVCLGETPPVLARIESRGPELAAPIAFSNQELPVGLIALDPNAQAALIAAENSALTEPIFWVDLPLIVR